MPIKGLEKGDGVPSSPCGLRRDKLGKRERTFPCILLSVIAAAPFGENGIATRRSQRRRAAA